MTLPDDPDVWYIHIDQMHIRRNQEDGGTRPVGVIHHRGEVVKASSFTLPGPATFIYNPDAPLNGGTRVWIETRVAPVILDAWNSD